ncbi:MAG: hypothetical protein H7Y86_20565 [Rhizobacter sp.]|nr:hypothetical protein [Ferruginibacter sp.]
MATKGTLKICRKGHQFYKSSNCPTCPICEKEKKPTGGFLSNISAPARRALENEGINKLKQLAKYSEQDLLQLHGFGPASLPILKAALQDAGLTFHKNKGS